MSTATTPKTKSRPPVSELSLSQLLGALEWKMDSIAKDPSQNDSTKVKQIDDVVSDIFRNSLVPVNEIPPETLASAATFFEPGLQLMNATVVCRHWRATLLSSPRLWNKINCSTKTTFETYLERSKSVPLEVQLCNTSPDLLEPLAPHLPTIPPGPGDRGFLRF